MHKIRTQARRHAWYADEGSPSLNPFGKYGVTRTPFYATGPDDVEAGLSSPRPDFQRATSDSRWRSEAEKQRLPNFGNPKRALSNQEPANSSAVNLPRSSTGGIREPLPPLSSSSSSPKSPTHDRSDEKENQGANNGTEDVSESTESGTSRGFTESSLGAAKEASQLNQIPTHTATEINEPSQKRGFFGRLRRRNGASDDKIAGEDGAQGGDATLTQTDTGRSTKRPHPPFTLRNQIQNTLFNSPINILLIFVPVGIALNFATDYEKAIFAINFVAIVPLAALLSYSTEEVALRTGETFGGLLNASFGNATELIVSVIALFKDEIIITQTSLIGSMLSNLLLVLGMCFFFGGLNRQTQYFNVTVAQTAASLLALALAGLIVPTIFDVQTQNIDNIPIDITTISRGVSVLLLLVYGCYLFFQLHTHIDIYNAPSKKTPKRNMSKGEATGTLASMGGILGMMAPEQARENMAPNQDEDDEEVPKLNIWVAVATLAISTALIALCSDAVVDNINAITGQGGATNSATGNGAVSKTFVGLILIPIVGNAAEHATAVTVACKDKMDLAIGVAVGSSMQIALLVLPLVVVIGWIAGKNDMNLDFDTFQVVILFISILLVNYLIADGESHWLEGAQLFVLYVIIALASWFYPQPCTGAAYYCPTSGSN